VFNNGMALTEESKEKIMHRLAKAMGHLNRVHKMVDEKRYCIDVLHQLKAVQAALDKTAEAMLKLHLETCVVEAIRNQDEERVVAELLQIFRKAPSLGIENDRTDKTLTHSVSETTRRKDLTEASAPSSKCC
jgi:CsoR family transcriptional regulator, copper-sensing transcriptional repressor